MSALLSLTLATTAVAASWDPPFLLGEPDGLGWPYAGGLATLGGTNGVAVYATDNGNDVARVYTRRTTNAGTTWGPPVLVSDHGYRPQIAASGSTVSLIWMWAGRIRYARSLDGGISFGSPTAISGSGNHARYPAIAVNGNIVGVAWKQDDGVHARVSHDGGASFGSVNIVASAPNAFPPDLAVGADVVHVAYGDREGNVALSRSTDFGMTWAPSDAWHVTLEFLEDPSYSIAADGARALVAYDTGTTLRYRRTTDAGAHWSDAKPLLPASRRGFYAVVTAQEGVFRAIYDLCPLTGNKCWRVHYSETTDGKNWSAPIPVSPKDVESYPRTVQFVGREIVIYNGFSPDYTLLVYARARVGQ